MVKSECLTKVTKSVKILEIKVFSTSFSRLGAFGGGFMVGV